MEWKLMCLLEKNESWSADTDYIFQDIQTQAYFSHPMFHF